MNFTETLEQAPVILTEGSLIERLRRSSGVSSDPHVEHAGLIYDVRGRARLEELYRGYLDVGRVHDIPMIVSPPTWRAGPDRLRAAGLHERAVNTDAVRFLADLRQAYGHYARQVFIAGLMGCKHDAYDPRQAIGVEEAVAYHTWQARELSNAGVDVILAATLPALSEALGIAQALSICPTPYMLSFVVRPSGTLLDGTPLHEAVAEIDRQTDRQPLAFMVNCTHPTVFASALETAAQADAGVLTRVVGLQANTSALSPEELDHAEQLAGEEPETFAEGMLDLHRRFGTKILDGCCGTDERHIAALAERLTR